MRDNWEYRSKCRLQAFVATLRGRYVGLQKARVGLDLRRQQERHVKDVGPLRKALANALFFGLGVGRSGGHGYSVSEARGQETGDFEPKFRRLSSTLCKRILRGQEAGGRQSVLCARQPLPLEPVT